jgi:hypothetical protein
VYESHKYQATSAGWFFHRVVPNLVLKIMSVMCQVRRAFEAFDDPDRDLAQFVELRIFPRCDKLLVP